MPAISKHDAETIMLVLMALRGLDKKKHKEAFAQGTLQAKPGDLSMQGTSQRWAKAIERYRSDHGGQNGHANVHMPPATEQGEEQESGDPKDELQLIPCNDADHQDALLNVEAELNAIGDAESGPGLHWTATSSSSK